MIVSVTIRHEAKMITKCFSFLILALLVVAPLVPARIIGDNEETIAAGLESAANKHRNLIFGTDSKNEAVGTIFGSLILGTSRNPNLKDELTRLALIGLGVLEEKLDYDSLVLVLGDPTTPPQ